MKIIRISGCHDCPHAKQRIPFSHEEHLHGLAGTFTRNYCGIKGFDITNKMVQETLPDNCPLEEEPRGYAHVPEFIDLNK